jgi:hypothetical protein
LPQAKLYLVTDAVRAIYPEEGDRLIAGWRDRGVSTVTVRQIVEESVLQRHLARGTVASSGQKASGVV